LKCSPTKKCNQKQRRGVVAAMEKNAKMKKCGKEKKRVLFIFSLRVKRYFYSIGGAR